MKINLLAPKSSPEYTAISLVLPEIGSEFADDGVKLALFKGKGLAVDKTGNNVMITYDSISSLLRAVSILKQHEGEDRFSVSEERRLDMLAPMLDQSRNAVLKPDQLKRFMRKIALMGYTGVMLYVEDTYTLEKYPYFGHLRGRYSDEELADLDGYAAKLGMELIPAIQTLAHVNALFHWSAFGRYRDNADILLSDDDKVYELIREMISHMSRVLTTRRINIGMDEAHMLGRGAHTDKFGYEERSVIMKRHLKKVVEICREFGYDYPMMWSDMFFRMGSPTGKYYDLDMNVTDEIRSQVPENVTLVYWDYYSIDKNRYDTMLKNHAAFKRKFAFAGGAACWYGLVPLNTCSAASAKIAMDCALKAGTKEVYVTMWGDNGATCSFFSEFTTLQIYAEIAYGEKTNPQYVEERMAACANANYRDFLSVEQICNLPGRTDFGEALRNPWRYMLWQDPLLGQFDRHIPEGAGEHFAKCAASMHRCAKRAGEYEYVFDSYSALSSVLELKADLGKNLRSAYEAGDKEKLAEYADKIIPMLLKRVDKFYEALRTQWMTENRPEGFDVQDIRFGALKQRLTAAIAAIKEYLSGKTEKIAEFENPCLTRNGVEESFPGCNVWSSIATANVL